MKPGPDPNTQLTWIRLRIALLGFAILGTAIAYLGCTRAYDPANPGAMFPEHSVPSRVVDA